MATYTTTQSGDSNLAVTVTENDVIKLNITPAAVTITSAVASVNGATGAVVLSTSEISEGSNLYYTNARADARISNNLLDEDDFASDSATNTASQQSIKAYVASQIQTKDNTDEITEGSSNLYFTNARADARAQLKIDALVDSAPGALDTLNELAAAMGDDANFSTTVTNSIATKLASADFNSTFDTRLGTKTTDNVTEGSSNLYFTNARARAAISESSTQLAYNSSTGVLTFTQGDTDTVSEGSSNLYFTNARADARVNNAIVDEDNFASDSATKVPTQQSVKAYIATQIATKDNTDEITEGSSNLYFTNARADARISNNILDEDNFASDSATNTASQQSIKAYIATQIATKDNTDEITEGSSNLYFTNARAQGAITASHIEGLNYDADGGTY
tara:strand:+ start:752 stop:1933 length:1182 start_codon:yes stop_codon:yes gene_type:complete